MQQRDLVLRLMTTLQTSTTLMKYLDTDLQTLCGVRTVDVGGGGVGVEWAV